MLKAQLIAAVREAVTALGDLAVVASHVRMAQPTHVPGTTPTLVETLYSVKVVITGYSVRELAQLGDRVQASDRQAIVLPLDGNVLNPPPKPNDLIRTGSINYRIIHAEHILAGTDTIASTLQLRAT